MRLFTLPITLLFLSFSILSAQTVKKETTASRVQDAPRIDGVLTDEVWKGATVANDFIQISPVEGAKASLATDVKVVYDNSAIYISAMLYDTAPDSILKELTLRDESGNSDVFGLSLDTYFDQQNIYYFAVTAAGVQIDEKLGVDNFDAVWESAVSINEMGWVVEMKIPYSAIRFPELEKQVWGLQFEREIRRTRESTAWQFVPGSVPEEKYPAYIGILNGIRDIQPPLRLSFTPYLGTTITHFPFNSPGTSNTSVSYNAGLDLKYGINESFTLDATLAPDFGQVQSDNKILNLSAYEVAFDENRPFFKEGTELFDQGNVFYARRIGKTPSGFYEVNDEASYQKIINNPSQVRLLNATKLTGRTSSGLGVGVLNAITAKALATVVDSTGTEREIETEPFTNFNVIALNQTLANSSSLSFINTNVHRIGDNNDANVSGLGFVLGNKANTYALNTFGAFSEKQTSAGSINGYKYNVFLSKVSGNFQGKLGRYVETDTYNPNDLGLLFEPDEINNYAQASYNTFKPIGPILRTSFTLGSSRSTTFKTRQYRLIESFLRGFVLSKSYFGVFGFVSVRPFGENSFTESRIEGMVYKKPAHYILNGGVSSDYRKVIALDAEYTYASSVKNEDHKNLSIRPIIRVSNHFTLRPAFDMTIARDFGFAAIDSFENSQFAFRKIYVFDNSLAASYVFTPKHSLSIRVRHYNSTVEVFSYHTLAVDGNIYADTTGYTGANNRNVSFFNVDWVYQWRFAPGSDLVFTWKNSIDPVSNGDKYVGREGLGTSYKDNFVNTFNASQLNMFSLKVLYYLDYQYFKKRK